MFKPINFETYINGSSTAFGHCVELHAAFDLRKRFPEYRVKRLRYGGHDLELTHRVTGEIIRIEVKAARRGKDKKYRATAFKRGATDYRKSDYIVFYTFPVGCAGANPVPFIIPVKEWNKPHIVITSHPESYSGKLKVYRNAWSKIQ